MAQVDRSYDKIYITGKIYLQRQPIINDSGTADGKEMKTEFWDRKKKVETKYHVKEEGYRYMTEDRQTT